MSKQILVIGGTRGTGKLAIDCSIDRGYSVTLVARDPAKARSLFGDTIRIIDGDVTRPESLQTAINSDFDAIIYTVDITGGVGGRGFFASRQSVREIVYDGVVNTINAAKKQGFQNQFILLTTLGLEAPSIIMTVLDTIKPGVIRASQDKATYLIESGLPYTIVQAGALHDGNVSSEPLVVSQADIPMQLNYQISRQHLAQILVAAVGNAITLDKTFNVYGGQELLLSPAIIDEQFQKLR
ncbi:NAD(P)H-binding protein [Chamaesiphon sp. GL140_3_metabinner_50]|uniref:NAD(P)H-binding protein n=1 Tax=Chamaesiphon sp. GL140_3_metabinner_50 TaxID=2970812 RepID=UPI0025EB20B5|nr:NAD(P)H-binding protein [Chamaesiphon sp. GL140_3_metabinner_50]